MGFDCTLHVVDEERISNVLVKLLMAREQPQTGMAADIDALAGHWDSALKSLAEDPPKIAASTLCQLALVFSSKT